MIIYVDQPTLKKIKNKSAEFKDSGSNPSAVSLPRVLSDAKTIIIAYLKQIISIISIINIKNQHNHQIIKINIHNNVLKIVKTTLVCRPLSIVGLR